MDGTHDSPVLLWPGRAFAIARTGDSIAQQLAGRHNIVAEIADILWRPEMHGGRDAKLRVKERRR
jgi:hypothetical protein